MLLQLITAVLLSLGLFIFVLVAANLMRVTDDLTSGRLPFSTLLEFMALVAVGMLPYAMPLGMLTGILLVLGRMSASNEILAMKAAGMNLWRIVSPIFFIAFLGTCISGYINCFQAPRAANQYKAMLKNAVSDNPAKLITPGKIFSEFKDFTIYAQRRDGETLKGVWIWEFDKRTGVPARTTQAEEATICFVESAERAGDASLRISLKNAVAEERNRHDPEGIFANQFRFSAIGNSEIEVPLDKIFSQPLLSKDRRKLKWFTLPELFELRDEGWRANPKTDAPEIVESDRIAVQLQIQNYLSSAMACFSLTILAIPLGIRISRSETFVNIGIALALALTFYLATIFLSWIENPAFRPDILVWIPNIVYQIVGACLLYKAAKN